MNCNLLNFKRFFFLKNTEFVLNPTAEKTDEVSVNYLHHDILVMCIIVSAIWISFSSANLELIGIFFFL